MIGRRFLICGAFLLGLAGTGAAFAQDSRDSRIGRISVADREVAVRADGKEWADSGVNHPIAAGMSVRTASQGRALLRIGPERVALAADTEIVFRQLDAGGTRIVLRRGRIGLSLAPSEPSRRMVVEIGRGGTWLLEPGEYDLTAGTLTAGTDGGKARVSVIAGDARRADNADEPPVAGGSVATVRDGDSIRANPADASTDEFVAWWRPAPGDALDPPALRYVSAAMTGYEALDAHGGWAAIEGYGAVWFPADTGDDWVPYRFGQWRWVPPWGWTWIDDKPWGFAPSHYGRWASFAEPDGAPPRWGWVPGGRDDAPAYAPAAVAFLGTAGVGLSYPDAFSPGVAWFPLAPGEIYWPRYTDDPVAIRRLNEAAAADPLAIPAGSDGDVPAEIVNGFYRNRRFATVVPRAIFVGGKPVAPAAIELPIRRLDNAPVLAGSPQISPPVPPQVAARTPQPVAPRIAKTIQRLARVAKTTRMPALRAAVGQVRLARPAAARASPAARPRAIAVPVVRGERIRHADLRRR